MVATVLPSGWGETPEDDARIFRDFEDWLARVAGMNITNDFGLAFTADPAVTDGRGRGVIAVVAREKGRPCIQVPIALALGPEGMLPIIKGVRYQEQVDSENHTGRYGGGKVEASRVDEADEADAEAIGLRLAYEAAIGEPSQYAPYVNLLGWPTRQPKCGVDTLLLMSSGRKPEPAKSSGSSDPPATTGGSDETGETTEGETAANEKAEVEAVAVEEEDPLAHPQVVSALFDQTGAAIKNEVERMRGLHTASLDRMEAAAERIGGPFQPLTKQQRRRMLHWALHMVKSRAHRGIGLVPVIDMFNDDLTAEVPTLYGEKPVSPEDFDMRMLGFECSRDYSPGQEIRYSYTGGAAGARSSVIQFGYLPDDGDGGPSEHGAATRALLRLAERERWQLKQEEEDTSPQAIYARRRREQEHLYAQWDL